MAERKIHEDQKYIDGLAQNNALVIRAVYDKFASKVIHYICNNSGDRDDAEDIIQEVLVIIYEQARDKNLKLTCPFDAYFFLLCKRKWLNELKKSSRKAVTTEDENVYRNEEAEILVTETDVSVAKEKLFEVMFDRLGKACKELLQASFRMKSMEEVADTLGITYAYARKKKSLCIGKLTDMVRRSPEYEKIKSS
ncbi:RNA polymerase sigma factor, sigma-70 family [Sinomicrobium oceani]|uniref:RNA polymerase sigma factor, sigma-70 family n=1 Tax=Sinomicrobium oceani TaxID=1150368 RepID=A0A1K1RRJ6_9FLAO|nr:sigma-70 family RNA polymerase sigma factor [Sinomicrobium oceani]SFW74705.1 RNA polymerase sigma factor, sigma-70 family [Sinomicrobium oceani]